ncbi:MAG: hypothetical protein J6O70_06400 [Lachnospiraceae bacterium]|nr:hypothetical protein [Lachnospiraceae bacterium]
MNNKINSLLNRLERRVGAYAVPQLTKYMILTYIIGYILYFLNMAGIPTIQLIYLSPEKILHGQIWRLFTWIFMPPSAPGIFTIIMLLFYYQLGTALEQTWGDFKYNLYIFSGLFFMLVGAFVLYGFGYSVDGMFTTYYVNMSVFLAFAACYPNMEILLYFIIPLKIKWLALIDIAFLLYQALVSSWAERVAIIVSLLNFVVFFFTTRNYNAISPKERARKRAFKKAFERGPYYQGNQRRVAGGAGHTGGASTGAGAAGSAYGAYNAHSAAGKDSGQITKHRCAICGRTELDGDLLEFRFCSKCAGNYEYCQDHLFTHEHVKFGK